MPPLDGKVAIVTGAGRYRGIGRHIGLAYRTPQQFLHQEFTLASSQ